MKLFSFGKTEIRLHWLLMAAWAVVMFTPFQTRFFILFTIVLLHELAHAFTARYYGFRILHIELHPFGGVAQISRGIAEKPYIERRIAIAGPTLNIALALVGYAVFIVGRHMEWSVNTNALLWFIRANVIIGGGNLLPALPLDGGRMIRSYLTERFGLIQATQHTVFISKVTATMLCAIGVFSLFFAWPTATAAGIAGIIWFSLKDEQRSASYTAMNNLIQRQTVPPAQTHFPVKHIAVFGHSKLYDLAMSYVPNRYYFMWHVTRGGQVKRLITEQHALETLFTLGPTARICDVISGEEHPLPCELLGG